MGTFILPPATTSDWPPRRYFACRLKRPEGSKLYTVVGGRDPSSLAFTRDGKYLVVSNTSSDAVQMIGADDNQRETQAGESAWMPMGAAAR